jgi:hypothetical protein
MNGSSRIRNAAFAAATVLALGFGAAQAFAAPQPAVKSGEKAFYCSPTSCNFDCQRRGAVGGFCENLGGYQSCACYY